MSLACFTNVIQLIMITKLWPQAHVSDADTDDESVEAATASDKQTPRPPKQKKKGKYADYESAPSDAVYFLFDVETTAPKRNYDRIIAISFFAHKEDGTLVGNFSTKINPT